jgi:superfamily I DNA/RNA helicase
VVVDGACTHPKNHSGRPFFKRNLLDHRDIFVTPRLGQVAEVKTFHAFCKKLLHRAYGGFVLSPFLTQVIAEDSKYLDLRHSHFDIAFQTLDEGSGEIAFYLERGDYYDAVSFNDSVYRVLLAVRKNAGFLPKYSQIVIDEFQDFNPLEVAFIDELQKKGPILIVGDDDQAVYSRRNSSPVHLREKFTSGEYETFKLPFCSRCPRAVVDATSSFIESVMAKGGFTSRIDRPFVPFLEDKEHENKVYPKIISANASTIECLAKLVFLSISNIPQDEVAEAYSGSYPCVLIVGQRQYLNPLHKRLVKKYDNVAFTQASGREYTIVDGYEVLRANDASNLGWRLLAGLEFSKGELAEMLKASADGSPFMKMLPESFMKKHTSALEILRKDQLERADHEDLTEMLGDQSQSLVAHFFRPEDEESEPDKSQPSILLSSFEGCKGLSAGHVFIVGLNSGVMPQVDPPGEVADIEISKFIVAMTRTRKLLYLLSNRWDYGPHGPRYAPSMFVDIIPAEFRFDAGYVTSDDAESVIDAAWDVG